MAGSPPSFRQRVFQNTTFAILDQIIYKLGTTVSFILIVRLLPESAVTAVGIGLGYIVLIALVEVGAVRILLRDYPQISRHPEERNLHFSAYILFLGLEAGAMLLLFFGIRVLVLNSLPVPGLTFLFLGMVIDFIALTVQEWAKMVFFTDLQQAFATKVSSGLSILRLGSYGLLLFSPTLETYTWLLIAAAAVSCAVWGFFFTQKFQFRPVFHSRVWGIIRRALQDYVLWDHFNRMALETLLMVDTAILTMVGQVHAIGSYTIALKVTSIFFLIPRLLTRSLQVALANYNQDRERVDSINTFLKVNAVISLGQLAVLLLAGPQVLFLLFGREVDAGTVLPYALVLGAAITILNIGFPLMGVVNAFTRLKDSFLTVFLPAVVFGVVAFLFSASTLGAMGMAYANLLVFFVFTVRLAFFVRSRYPFALRFQWVTGYERRLLHEIVRSFPLAQRFLAVPAEDQQNPH